MRWTVALVAALSCLLAGSTASAVVGPTLVVSGSATDLSTRGSTTIDLDVAAGMAGTFVVYAPPGFSAQLERPVGTSVGSVSSAVVAVGGTDAGLTGSVVQADPTAVSDSGCSPGAHAAAWSLQLAGAGTTVTASAVLDPVVAAPESSYASYRLEVCLGDLHVRRLTIKLDGLFESPDHAGAFVWRAVASTDGGEPAAELRSTMLLPVAMSLTGRYDVTAMSARLRGTLTAGGRPVPDAPVVVTGGNGAGLHAETDARGRFEVRKPISAGTAFRASAAVGTADITADGCASPIAAGGCVAAVVSPFSARSNAVRVAPPPPPPTLRLGSRGASVRRLQERLIRLHYLPGGAVSGVFDERTWHAVVAFQGWQGLGRNGVVVGRTWRVLEQAHAPVAPSGSSRGLVIDVPRQVLLLVANGRVQRAIHVSTAAPGHYTPRGRFSVFRKEVMSWSIPFEAWMPYANYFTGGFAIHGFASVPPYPASHGCVRVPMVEAPGVYAFASYGTVVVVR